MKKNLILLASLLMVSGGLFAQKFKVSGAEVLLGQGDVAMAKQDIDDAAKHEKTANDPYMWKVRGDVYYSIATDSVYVQLDPNAAEISLTSYINCINVEKGEKKKKYTEDALRNLSEAGVPVYFKAFGFYQKGEYKESLRYWEVLLKGFEADTTGGIDKRLSMAKNDVVQNCANIAYKMEDNAATKKYLDMLINDPKYKGSYAFLQMSFMLQAEGDTTAALEVVDKGRKRIPDDKDLFNHELNIYTQMGKTNTLIKKLNEVIENEPNNTLYLFFRGTIVSDYAYKIMDKGPQFSDSASAYRKKVTNSAKPADKKKYQAQVDMFLQTRDSIYAEATKQFEAAEKDFNEALLLDPNYYDALFNIGVLHFNKNKILVDKYNYLEYSEAQTKGKDLEVQMKTGYEKALDALLKAYEIKPDDKDVMKALQQTYSLLGNKEKSEEFRLLRGED